MTEHSRICAKGRTAVAVSPRKQSEAVVSRPAPEGKHQRGARAYPGKVAIRQVVEAARSVGIDVAGIEVTLDGTIRAIEARAIPKTPDKPQSLFDQLEAEGKI